MSNNKGQKDFDVSTLMDDLEARGITPRKKQPMATPARTANKSNAGVPRNTGRRLASAVKFDPKTPGMKGAAFGMDDAFSPGTLARIQGGAGEGSGGNRGMEDVDSDLSGDLDTSRLEFTHEKPDSRNVLAEMDIRGVHTTGTLQQDSDVDTTLIGDPRVLMNADKVILRSFNGPCLDLNSESTMAAKGNPSSLNSHFKIVRPGGSYSEYCSVVHFGDKVMLKSCSPSGGFLGALKPGDLDYEAALAESMAKSSFHTPRTDLEEYRRDQQSHLQDQHVLCVMRHQNNAAQWILVAADDGGLERKEEKRLRCTKGRVLESDASCAVRSSDALYLKKFDYDSAHGPLFLQVTDNGELSLTSLNESHDNQGPSLNNAATWNIVKNPAPFRANWSRERRLLNGDYSCSDAGDFVLNEHQQATLAKSGRDQEKMRLSRGKGGAALEAALVDDLLFALQGVPGDLVMCDQDENGRDTWHVSQALVPDLSLRALASKFTPLCAYFSAAERFVLLRSRPEFGRVSHSLGAAMNKLLREFQVLLAQLEHQKQTGALGLQKLWFYVQPAMRTLEILASVSNKVRNHTGGALLNAVHALSAKSGDPKSRTVFKYLLENAATPYLEMFELWIYQGVIRDPYHEFMVCVEREASITTMSSEFNARYWAHRYTLRSEQGDAGFTELQQGQAEPSAAQKAEMERIRRQREMLNDGLGYVPFFLDKLAPQILTTGKYLNVIRECGRWVQNECQQQIVFSSESHAYDAIVARAHGFASQSLLTLLLEEEKLMARLRSIKHYFLLDQGDFFVHFMDLAGEELKMLAKDISVSRLQSLLEMCLRARNINDPFQEDLECELSSLSIIQHVTHINRVNIDKGGALLSPDGNENNMLEGVSAFTLDFKVRWPLSLVISREALTKYQLIFRHLFYCKHVETRICASWLQQQSTKELNLRSLLGPQYALLQRMLHFLQNFEYYVMFEVLEPRWHEFEKRLSAVKTVDELMKIHVNFLDTCLRECLLTDKNLLKVFAKLMTICIHFAESQENFARNLDQGALAIESGTQLALTEQQESKTQAPGSKKLTQEEARAEMHTQQRRARARRKKIQEDNVRNAIQQTAYRRMFENTRNNFDKLLNDFMDQLVTMAESGEYHSHLKNLCQRLDYNSFYKTSKEKGFRSESNSNAED